MLLAALTAPLATAALLLCLAGIAKLRSRADARWLLVAAVEIGVAGWCLIAPGRLAMVALVCTYAALAVASLVLSRRGVQCGCFGADQTPASRFQSVLSAAFALVALAGVVTPPHGLEWVAHQPLALLLGIASGAYAARLAYTELPRAWGAWGSE